MAAGSIPAPGSELGPCEEECRHIDCAQSRAMAASVCTLCLFPIGYGVLFYNVQSPTDSPSYAHARCLEAIEQKGAK